MNNNELYLVATIQTFTDGDGIDQYGMNTCVLPKEKALSRLSGKVYHMGNKLICVCEGAKGRCGWGSFENCYLAICPATENAFIDGGKVAWFMNDELDAEYDAEDEIVEMEKEIEGNIPEEKWTELLADETDPEFPAKETARNRKHVKGDEKARRHLSAIFPVQSEIAPIRKTRNGAYIHKGNTYSGNRQWKRSFTKQSREESKREIRGYIPEEETFDETEIRRTPTEIEEEITKLDSFVAELREEMKWLEKRVNNLQERRLQLVLGLEDEPRHWSF